MSGPLNGIWGAIDGIADVMNWVANETSEAVGSMTSATKGATRRSSGIIDRTFSYSAKGGIPLVKPYVLHNFKGYSAPDAGVYGADGVIIDCPVYATSITINMNFGGNEDVNHSIELAGSGAQVIGSGFYEDDDDPIAATICPCKIEYGASGAEVEIDHIKTATLTFTIGMAEIINSSTNCAKQRSPGGIDWTLDIEIEDNVRPIAIQSDERLKVWINATQFFILEFGHLEGYSNFNVDTNNNTIISQTMNWKMQSHKQSDLTTIGQIIWPDTSVVWPQVATP